MNHCLFLLSLLLAASTAYGQSAPPARPPLPVDSVTHRITYAGIIAVPHASQDELYTRGKIWFAQALRWPQSVLLVAEQPAGLLVGRQFGQDTLLLAFLPTLENLQYTIKLSCKAGKYRYILTDFHFENAFPTSQAALAAAGTAAEPVCFAQRPNGTPTPMALKHTRTLAQAAQRMVANLQAGMRQGAAGGPW